MSMVYPGDPSKLMRMWLENKQDCIISCGHPDMVKPWIYWIRKVLVQTALNKEDLIDRVLHPPNLYITSSKPQPLTVFLFRPGTNLYNCKSLVEAWNFCQVVRDRCALLVGDPSDRQWDLNQHPFHLPLDILFTTPKIYKHLLEQDIIGSAWTQIIVFYKVENEMDDAFIHGLDRKLHPPESRSSIMITNSFGSNARAVVQKLFKSEQNRVFLPFWSNNKMYSARRPELLKWISSRPKGDKILVLSVGPMDANMLARQGNRSSDGKQIISAMRYSSQEVRAKVFRDFNNGVSTVLSVVKDDLDDVDLTEVDSLAIFDFTPNVYIINFNASPFGFFQDHKRPYMLLFKD